MNANRFFCSILTGIALTAVWSLSAALAANEPASQPAPAPAPQPPPHIHNPIIIAPGGGAPMDPERIRQAELDNLNREKQNYDALPDAGTFQIGDLLQVTIEDGKMKVQFTQKDSPEGGPQFRAKVQGLSDPLAATAQWKITRLPGALGNTTIKGPAGIASSGAPAGKGLLVTRYDFDQDKPGQIWQSTMTSRGDFVSIIWRGIGLQVILSQSTGLATTKTTHLTISWGQEKPSLVCSADSMVEILQQHPVEVCQYLSPLLLRLTGRDLLAPGPADIYSAFAEIPADASVAKAVADLLVQMGADAFDKRETASAELAKLGTPGILAVLRLDRSKLSQEQKTRCDQFLRTGKTLDFGAPAEALHNVYFLLDAMNDADIRVREAAKTGLEKLQGHGVDIDVSAQADAAVRRAALDKLCADQAAKEAATQPAGGN